MNDQNPIPEAQPDQEDLTSREFHNIVTDTVTGVNLRWKDNVIQAIVIAVFTVIGAVASAITGACLSEESPATGALFGALAGGLLGLIVGLVASGFFLMIYRAVQHMHGHHD